MERRRSACTFAVKHGCSKWLDINGPFAFVGAVHVRGEKHLKVQQGIPWAGVGAGPPIGCRAFHSFIGWRRAGRQPQRVSRNMMGYLYSSGLVKQKSIVLIGLMGAGKSSVGRRMAQRLCLPYADADDEIARAAGRSVADIFDSFGEAAFREGERRVIARLLTGPAQVLATGGGAFMDPQTRETIARRAISVWLRADLDTLVERTKRRTDRPLLRGGDRRSTLTTLMAERYPVYAQADITVDTAAEPPDVTTERVRAALESAGAFIALSPGKCR